MTLYFQQAYHTSKPSIPKKQSYFVLLEKGVVCNGDKQFLHREWFGDGDVEDEGWANQDKLCYGSGNSAAGNPNQLSL